MTCIDVHTETDLENHVDSDPDPFSHLFLFGGVMLRTETITIMALRIRHHVRHLPLQERLAFGQALYELIEPGWARLDEIFRRSFSLSLDMLSPEARKLIIYFALVGRLPGRDPAPDSEPDPHIKRLELKLALAFTYLNAWNHPPAIEILEEVLEELK